MFCFLSNTLLHLHVQFRGTGLNYKVFTAFKLCILFREQRTGLCVYWARQRPGSIKDWQKRMNLK